MQIIPSMGEDMGVFSFSYALERRADWFWCFGLKSIFVLLSQIKYVKFLLSSMQLLWDIKCVCVYIFDGCIHRHIICVYYICINNTLYTYMYIHTCGIYTQRFSQVQKEGRTFENLVNIFVKPNKQMVVVALRTNCFKVRMAP